MTTVGRPEPAAHRAAWIAARASTSQRSFSAIPAWPGIHSKRRLANVVASARACSIRCLFARIFHALVSVPIAYSLSVWRITCRSRSLMVESARTTALSSAMLLVASPMYSEISLRWLPQASTIPMPAGPGVPEHAPSVKARIASGRLRATSGASDRGLTPSSPGKPVESKMVPSCEDKVAIYLELVRMAFEDRDGDGHWFLDTPPARPYT